MTDIATLRAAIADQQKTIQKATQFTTNMPNLLTQRENLLADIAIGTKNKSDLENIDREIGEEQKRLDANSAKTSKIVSEAKDTIAGLERNLQITEAALSDLVRKDYDIIYDFLLSEAEQIGVAYADACNIVADKHRQLLAINALMNHATNYDRRKSILPVLRADLVLPIFKVKSVLKLSGPVQPGHESEVYEANRNGLTDVINSERERQRERIKTLGVNL